MDICPKCGLPKDLCACETIAKEQQKIIIKSEKRRYGKKVTVITGFNDKTIDMEGLIKTLKQKLACGGTLKSNVIELQGEHSQRVKKTLINQGFPEESIQII